MQDSEKIECMFNYCDQLANRLDEHQKRLNIQRNEINELLKRLEQLEKNTREVL